MPKRDVIGWFKQGISATLEDLFKDKKSAAACVVLEDGVFRFGGYSDEFKDLLPEEAVSDVIESGLEMESRGLLSYAVSKFKDDEEAKWGYAMSTTSHCLFEATLDRTLPEKWTQIEEGIIPGSQLINVTERLSEHPTLSGKEHYFVIVPYSASDSFEGLVLLAYLEDDLRISQLREAFRFLDSKGLLLSASQIYRATEAERARVDGYRRLAELVLHEDNGFNRKVENLLEKLSGSLFRAGDLKDPKSLLAKLRDGHDLVSQYLASQFSADTRRLLTEQNDLNLVSESLERALIDEFNRLLRGPSLFEEHRFAQVALTEETRTLIEQNPQNKEVIRLNRLLLEQSYPEAIVKIPLTKLKNDLSLLGIEEEDLDYLSIRIESKQQLNKELLGPEPLTRVEPTFLYGCTTDLQKDIQISIKHAINVLGAAEVLTIEHKLGEGAKREPLISLEPTVIERIIRNSVKNSYQSGRKRGMTRINVDINADIIYTEGRRFLELIVRDNAGGLPSHDFPPKITTSIWLKYCSNNSRLAGRTQGNGLLLVSRYSDSSGGTFFVSDVESADGKGVEYRISIGLQDALAKKHLTEMALEFTEDFYSKRYLQ